MGLFDKIFKSTETSFIFKPQNEQEAWIGIMYSCIAVDGDVSEAEIDKLAQIAVFKQNFQGHDIAAYHRNILSAHKQIGSKVLIDNCAQFIKGESKPTLFALIMELLLSDGILGEKEKERVEYVSQVLSLDNDTSSKIVEVMLIKNKWNVII